MQPDEHHYNVRAHASDCGGDRFRQKPGQLVSHAEVPTWPR